MTREQHLKFCEICVNRRLDLQRGLVCKLTDDLADFEENCPDYQNDHEEEERLHLQRLEMAGGIAEGDAIDFKKNKANGIWCILLGFFSFFFTLLFSTILVVVPIGLFIYGISMYKKGAAQEKILKEKA